MARAPNADFQALLKMRRVYGRPPLIKAKDITDFNRLTVLLLEGPLAKEQRSEMEELLAKMFFEADGIDLKAIYDTDPEASAEAEKCLARIKIDLEERKALLEGRKPKAPATKAQATKAPTTKTPAKKTPATPVSAETPTSNSPPTHRVTSESSFWTTDRKDSLKGTLVAAGFLLFLVGISLGMCGYDSTPHHPVCDAAGCY